MIYVMDEPEITTSITQITRTHKAVGNMEDSRWRALDKEGPPVHHGGGRP